MNYKLLKIKPTDNTFFGTGNRFNYDISDVIKSRNIAYPSTFFGAVFTALLSQNNDFREKFFRDKTYDEEEILSLGQIYLYSEKENRTYIKAPLDLFINEYKDIEYGYFKKIDGFSTSLNSNYYLDIDVKDERLKDSFIRLKDFYKSYPNLQDYRLKVLNENNIFAKNNKIGIGIDKNTKNVETGKLYKIQQTEFINDEWSFVVEYDIDKDYLKRNYKTEVKLNDGFLKLGGENKVCKYKNIINDEIEEFSKTREENNSHLKKDTIYKIILTSDSYFEKDIENILNEDINIKLLGVVNDKPIYISGYDMKKRNGKEVKNEKGIKKSHKGYSAGTIFLIKNNAENINLDESIRKKNGTKGFNNYIAVECNNIEEVIK
ncbi:type III-B CRISPR module-associated Cmr3 family protein [Anaerovorax odorimutans]|uniref:type III-B CRISPR module-associated Cmr3 family protein n=1 Tax=Anaerovorax odorimutans TaxID=109327 RepID=UPI000418718D|nr:type III-B CRISPR module-associated Cmr3 family protein [Anaerovorax odorimutans]